MRIAGTYNKATRMQSENRLFFVLLGLINQLGDGCASSLLNVVEKQKL
jgi:hypothetical protein